MSINIAIDGPAGAGKSTIARRVAQQLGYIYVDTGALYRAVALFAVQRNVDLDRPEHVAEILPMIDIELKYVGGEQCVYLCGENVSRVIRNPKISSAASIVSAMPKVREHLFDLQLEIAQENNVIMDGRDIGTVVLPHAQIKIFLTASAEERARRRFSEMVNAGMKANYEEVLADIQSRDYNDTHRAIAPLRQAPDAILVDTTEYDLEQAVELVYNTIIQRLPQ